MKLDNVIVSMRLDHIERFEKRDAWDRLAKAHVAYLPSEVETDEDESRIFDLTILGMQLTLMRDDALSFGRGRKKVHEIAKLQLRKRSRNSWQTTACKRGGFGSSR